MIFAFTLPTVSEPSTSRSWAVLFSNLTWIFIDLSNNKHFNQQPSTSNGSELAIGCCLDRDMLRSSRAYLERFLWRGRRAGDWFLGGGWAVVGERGRDRSEFWL
uniref:Uncharacterized protein n=1 Tax=Triticum urartu TaxID=4572 RepID=A0A8R7UZZ4_TRIUA